MKSSDKFKNYYYTWDTITTLFSKLEDILDTFRQKDLYQNHVIELTEHGATLKIQTCK